MTTRINMYGVNPKALEGMMTLEAHFRTTTIEPLLRDLIKMRASQINGCAFCLHMHSKDARAQGEREERLHLLSAWRESSLYTPRERAALAWTEALTLIAQTGAPDADYEGLKGHFSEAEIVDLSLLITTINAWNRLAVGFRGQHPRAWAPEQAAA
ncbi:carboxymuconolactone decarboxylase family protein [Phenylobacterium sp.]|uniref:carboxymuconolactone decarboxylase family protein n=1 Tax=Phenylobacterium sp. TaxID=1871053 RepID=UPI0025FF4A11|nr:carboxymuconolactone decarboxylase family protein [Phenylobacterium sp.]MBX3483125.1 carboxymuconolactone decarboxylase family protein [Phenylobacterium sp.]MCW5760760.1 carboxymuconolactone decarboxylase family protein [Phenylobacterium sp.]